jgi:apolipoprotein N-acyltransferase
MAGIDWKRPYIGGIVLPIAGGILTAVSFPDLNLSILAWCALVPVLISVEDVTGGTVFRRAWLFGFTGFVFNLAWVRHTMIDYGGLPVYLSIFFLVLLALYCGLYPAVSIWCASLIRSRTGLAWVVVLPVLWVSFEYFRAHALTGFPWNALGQSQYRCLPLLQNADWGSFYGISCLLVAVNAVLYKVISPDPFQQKIRESIAMIIVICMLFGYGFWRLSGLPQKQQVTVALVQGNVDQHAKWDKVHKENILDRHILLTDSILDENPDLIVWSESALTFYYRYGWRYPSVDGGTLGDKLDDLLRRAGVPLVTGTLDKVDEAIFNSACLVRPDGLVSYYYKMHLVPFGEYVPLRKILFFVDRMVISGIGNFDTGNSFEPLRFNEHALGLTICYENIFPHFVRRFVREGADIICNVTNDAWFGESAAPEQHFSASVFRAVENRRPVIRAANTGITGAIDQYGRILARSQLFEETAFTVAVHPGYTSSVYTIWGDIFAWICLLVSSVLIVLSFVRPGRFKSVQLREPEV